MSETQPAGDSGQVNAADLEGLRHYGIDAVSFQALKHGVSWWRDAPAPEGTGARLGYVQAGRTWIGIGTPLIAEDRQAAAVGRFAAAARAAGKRAAFFGVENLRPFAECRHLMLGLQPVLHPAAWDATLRQWPRLREQLRRARAKGVTVRRVAPGQLTSNGALRRDVERLRSEWLRSRAMEPLGFLVAVEPFHAPGEHLYFVAEHRGTAVQFLSAVPIYRANGWLMEDMLRGLNAPNGTTELVIDALMRTVHSESSWVTGGLTPLTGPITWWLRLARFATLPLYDFGGLWRFRARLHPSRWNRVWLVWDRGPTLAILVDVLRAFAAGRLVRFGLRTLLRHPNGPPWAVAVPLVPWTAMLAVLAWTGHGELLGFPLATLRAWTIFDAVLAWLLFKVARKPRAPYLAALAAAAAFDAIVSVQHLISAGFGTGVLSGTLRLAATAGPVLGTAALTLAMWHALRRAKPSARP